MPTPTFIDDSDGSPAFTSTGPWLTFGSLAAPQGGYGAGTCLVVVAGGTSALTATWTATGLATDGYDVWASWRGRGGTAVVAYDIYDGATLLATVSADQGPEPTVSMEGTLFAHLGAWRIAGGTLRVVLRVAAGTAAMADAVAYQGGAVVAVPPSTATCSAWVAPSGKGIYLASSAPLTAYDSSKAVTLTRDGVAVALMPPAWGANAGTPDKAYFPLPATAPASEYFPPAPNGSITKSNFNFSDNNAQRVAAAAAWPAFGTQPTSAFTGTAGGAGTFRIEGRPAGTYRLCVGWAPNAANTTAATWKVEASQWAFNATDGRSEDGAWTTVATATKDQTAAPSGVSDGPAPMAILGTFTLPAGCNTLRVTVSNAGAAGTTLVVDSLRLDRTDAAGPAPIAASSAVSLAVASGAFSAADGPIAAATIAATNPGRTLPAFSPKTRTLKVGWNVSGPGPFASTIYYSNLLKGMQMPNAGSGCLAKDANGYPTLLDRPSMSLLVIGGQVDYGGSGRGSNPVPGGYFTLLWDGPSAGMSFPGVAGTLTPGANGVGNKLVANLPAGLDFSPTVYVNFNGVADGAGHYTCAVTNARLLPPNADGSAATNLSPPKFHPSVMAQIRGGLRLRTMDAQSIVNTFFTTTADLPPTSYLTFGASRFVTTTKAVSDVRGYTGTDTYLCGRDSTILQVTVPGGHGLGDGWITVIRGCGTASFVGGKTAVLDGLQSIARVISPTVFLFRVGGFGARSVQMSGSLQPTAGTIQAFAGGLDPYGTGLGGACMPPEDIFDFYAAAGMDGHFHVHTFADDGLVAHVAAVAAASYAARPTTAVLHVEYTNEPWNIYQFEMWEHLAGLARVNFAPVDGNGVLQDAPTYLQYCYRANQIRTAFRSAFTSAGLDPNRVRMVANVAPYSGAGTPIDTVLQLMGGHFQAVTGLASNPLWTATGPPVFESLECSVYPDNVGPNDVPGASAFRSVWDGLDADQCLDVYEGWLARGLYRTQMAAHRTMIDAAGLAVKPKLGCYELGRQNLVPYQNSNATSPAVATRFNAAHRHPRGFGQTLDILQQVEDGGADGVANIYEANSGNGSLAAWENNMGWQTAPGTGDPAADAANVADPTDLTRIVSEGGAAVLSWNAAVAVVVVAVGSGLRRIRGLRRWRSAS